MNSSRLDEVFAGIGYADPAELPKLSKKLRKALGRKVKQKNRATGPCGKDTFTSQWQAKKAIRNRLRKGANTTRLIAYFCRHCHGWHMSSREPGRAPK